MITKKKIRKIFPAISLTVTTEVVGNPMQIYDSKIGVWSPDRTSSANHVQFVPHVMAQTGVQEKTWTDGDYGKRLQDVTWFANGRKIQEVSALAGGYSIGTGESDKNTLTIKKNFSPSEHYDLTFEGYLYDERTKSNIFIHSDAVQIGISESAEQEWDFSVAHDVNIKYYPLLDRLKEYDWKVENGIIEANTAVRNECMDGNHYLRTLPIVISQGSNIIDSDHKYWNLCEMRMFIYDKDGHSTRYYADDGQILSFVKELTTEQMTVDLRLVPDGTILEVALFVNNVKMASEFLSFSLVINDYFCDTQNEGDLDINAKYRYDRAVFCVNGRKLQYPEAYFDIKWYTNSADAANGQSVYHCAGEIGKIDLSKAHIGTASDCWLEVYVDTNVKALVAALTTDDDGNIVLVNSESKVITVDMLTN